MIGKRTAFELCGRSGLASLVLRGRKCLPALWLTVLAYHRIGEVDPNSPWDSGLISATPETFRQQLAFVKRHFNPVSSEQVVLWKQGHFQMPRNPIVVTFDDGYLDNSSAALPLLLEAGVPADFFICPWNIENRRLFWWDKMECCLRRTRKDLVELTYPKRVQLHLKPDHSMRTSRTILHRMIRETPELNISALLDQLQERTGVEIDERAEADRLLMNWDHVRGLRKAGMGVGSHSYSHPILSMADKEAVRVEMARSKSAIEEQLNERIRALAYPVGCYTNGTKTLAREAGYEIAYSYSSGASFLRSADLLEVRRIGVERFMSPAHFRAMLAVPFLS